MAFSRDFLKALSLTDEQVSAIIQEHTSVTDALKAQRDKAKEELETAKKDAAKVPELQKEIDGLKGGEDWKSKYEKAVKDHDDYVKGIEEKELGEKVKAAYKQLLTDEQIKADRIDVIMRHTDFANMKLDKEGKLTDIDNLKKAITDDWGVFKVTTKERKQSVATPPENNGGSGEGRARELYLNHLKQQGVKVDTGKE